MVLCHAFESHPSLFLHPVNTMQIEAVKKRVRNIRLPKRFTITKVVYYLTLETLIYFTPAKVVNIIFSQHDKEEKKTHQQVKT